MRFQKLTIHNIASIEDAVIDFDAKPLADSELFLITGKTGAGKSTLLDAICLALYNDTPRFNNTEMQGETQDMDITVKVNDVRQLMRRNTAEAEVRLTFVGSNGVPYEAKWSVARSRKKVNGKIQPKRWELTNLKGEYTLTKDVEIKEEIRAAIGLDFNQFCRTTLLAQGEFTRFLNSKDGEKADILEKITGTAIYSEIGAKVYAVTMEKKAAWEEAQRSIEGKKTLSEEEIAEKQTMLQELGQQYDTIKKQREEDVAKEQWLKTSEEQARKCAEAQNAWQEATAALQQEEFKTKEKLVNDWNATIEARHWWSEVQRAEQQQQDIRLTLNRLAEDYRRARSGRRFIDQEAKRLEAELAQTEAFLGKEKDKAGIYEKAQGIEAQLHILEQGRIVGQELKAQLEANQRRLDETLKPQWTQMQKEADAAGKALSDIHARVQEKEAAVKQLNLSELRSRRDGMRDLQNKIGTAKERMSHLAQEQERREKSRKLLEEKQLHIEALEKTQAEMEQPVHDAEVAWNTHKALLDKEKETIEDFAVSLRARLQVGDTCPICRQKIEHDIPHEEVLSQLIGKLQAECDKSEKEYKSLKDKQDRAAAELKAERNAYRQAKEAFDADTSVQQAEKRVAEARLACGMEGETSDPEQALKALEEKAIKELSALEQQIASGETQEKVVVALRAEEEKKRQESESANRQKLEAEEAVKECQRRLQSTQEVLLAKKREMEKAEGEVQSALGQTEWPFDWKSAPKEFSERLLASAKEYANRTAQRTEALNQKTTLGNYAQQVDVVLKDIQRAMPAWQEEEAAEVVEVSDLLPLVHRTLSQVTALLEQQKSAQEASNRNRLALNEFLQKNAQYEVSLLESLNRYSANEIQAVGQSLEQVRANSLQRKTLLDEALRGQEEHQRKRPTWQEEDTPELLRERIGQGDAKLQEISEKRGSIQQELKVDADSKRQKSALIEETEKRSAEYQRWARLNNLIGDSTGSKFQRIAQTFILSSLIHAANGYMKTLTDRYTLKVAPGTFVISIEDAYQGYTSRAASTISGGESFLVSLSLALALSDIGQNLAVDTLFIDEGFGTLSGEPLQNAINTLRALHTRGNRHVGIISHVEELRDRIPVQIQVHQEGNNSSSTVRVVG